ncbi:Uncharacterised protein [uncultured archaeon]|nr:Uncharacterised protein [uncultured archaeon]
MNKKYFYLLGVVLFLFVIFFVSSSLEENPQQAFSENSSSAWETLNQNPDLLENPSVLNATFNDNPFLASQLINENPSLLDNEAVAKRFNEEVSRNISLLNLNPDAKKFWFKQRGIIDEGVELDGYDGTTIQTRGIDATSFKIDDFPGARVLPSGRVILPNGAEVSGGSLSREGNTHFVQGNLDLSRLTSGNFEVSGGQISLRDRAYVSGSDSPVSFSIDSLGQRKVSGEDVIILDQTNQEIFARFNGGITEVSADHMQFSEGTTFKQYYHGLISSSFNVGSSTDYFLASSPITPEKDTCFEGVCYFDQPTFDENSFVDRCENALTSCISFDRERGFASVNSLGNQIAVENLGGIDTFNVHEVTGEGSVTFSSPRARAIFSSDRDNPISVQGDPRQLSSILSYDVSLENEKGEIEKHKIIIDTGEVSFCTECKLMGGSSSGTSDRPEKVTGVYQLSGNDKELRVSRYLQKKLSGTDYSFQEVKNGEDLSNLAKSKANILAFTGHHYTGQDGIFNQAGSTIRFQDLPSNSNVQMMYTSSCHSVMNPEYLRSVASSPEQAASFIQDYPYQKEFQTAEGFVKQMESKFPNLRLIVGWESKAPLDDTFAPKVVDPSYLEGNGFKAVGDKALDVGKTSLGSFKEKDSNGNWKYNLANEGGKSMAYYYKDDKGVWKFYSNEHPEGIPLIPPSSRGRHEVKFVGFGN